MKRDITLDVSLLCRKCGRTIVSTLHCIRILLHDVYDRARYDLVIDYTKPPVPPLHDDDRAWARQLLSAE